MGRVQNIRNRAQIRDQRILDLIATCKSTVTKLGFTIPKKLRFLSCKADHRAGLACYTDTTIVLSTFIFKESDEAICKIIYHEIGHIIAGPGVHHGPAWKKIVNKIGRATNLTIKRCYSAEDLPIHCKEARSASKYTFVCKGCGSEIHYNRRTEFVNTYNEIMFNGKPRWTCRSCGGTFELKK